jgi:hypothetical protein
LLRQHTPRTGVVGGPAAQGRAGPGVGFPTDSAGTPDTMGRETMEQRRDVVRRHVADMLAVQRALHDAFARQRADERLDRHPHARTLVTRVEDALQRQIEALESAVDPPPNDGAAPRGAGVAAELGTCLQIGRHVSCVLRDGYTALAFASVSYEMLHTTALAAGDADVAALTPPPRAAGPARGRAERGHPGGDHVGAEGRRPARCPGSRRRRRGAAERLPGVGAGCVARAPLTPSRASV